MAYLSLAGTIYGSHRSSSVQSFKSRTMRTGEHFGTWSVSGAVTTNVVAVSPVKLCPSLPSGQALQALGEPFLLHAGAPLCAAFMRILDLHPDFPTDCEHPQLQSNLFPIPGRSFLIAKFDATRGLAPNFEPAICLLQVRPAELACLP